jgi:hypothetical protein
MQHNECIQPRLLTSISLSSSLPRTSTLTSDRTTFSLHPSGPTPPPPHTIPALRSTLYLSSLTLVSNQKPQHNPPPPLPHTQTNGLRALSAMPFRIDPRFSRSRVAVRGPSWSLHANPPCGRKEAQDPPRQTTVSHKGWLDGKLASTRKRLARRALQSGNVRMPGMRGS